MTSDGEVLRLVGLIYDSVIDPAGWETAIEAVVRQFKFHNGMLAVNALPRGNVTIHVAVNVNAEQMALAYQYGEHIVELWGGAERIAQYPLEEPQIQSQASDPASWQGNPYYRHFVVPQGITDAVGIALVRDSNTVASLGLGRHGSAPPITEDDMAGLRRIAPHLTRAVLISRLLDESHDAATSFSAALDASPSAVVLVDRHGLVVHANAAGDAMLVAGDPIRRRQGRLELVSELAPGRFAAALNAAANEAELGRRGLGIPVRRRDGTPLVLRIMPLARRTERGGTSAQASAAVFIAETGHAPDYSHDVLDLLFELTPAEAKVFALVAEGLSTKAAASSLGTAPSTIKTHLMHIFRKTNTGSRAELLRLTRTIGQEL